MQKNLASYRFKKYVRRHNDYIVRSSMMMKNCKKLFWYSTTCTA